MLRKDGSSKISKMHFFMPLPGLYGSQRFFTRKFCEALKRQGVEGKIFDVEEDDSNDIIREIIGDSPDCTCMFGVLDPDNRDADKFLCDYLHIPHLSLVVDMSAQYAFLSRSPYTLIASSDMQGVEYLKQHGIDRSMFIPMAVDSASSGDVYGDRQYDVAFFGSCFDYDAIQKSWELRYPENISGIIEGLTDTVLGDQGVSFIESIDAAWENSGLVGDERYSFEQFCVDAEWYLRGKARVEMIRSIRDAHVHVFGYTKNFWEKFFSDVKNVTIHDPVDHEGVIDIMRRSKVVLSSSPSFNTGGHVNMFYGLAAGSLVIADDNAFVRENFVDGEDLVMYSHGRREELNGIVCEYLADDEKRRSVAERGQKKVFKDHTWDVRAKALLNMLPDMLAVIKAPG